MFKNAIDSASRFTFPLANVLNLLHQHVCEIQSMQWKVPIDVFTPIAEPRPKTACCLEQRWPSLHLCQVIKLL